MVVNQRVATIKVLANESPSYIDIAIRSEMTQEVIRTAKNSTNDNISMVDIKGFVIPLPPLAEQRRIVAKVDQLMALVDELETRLVASRATAANLLSALVAEVMAASKRGIAEGRRHSRGDISITPDEEVLPLVKVAEATGHYG